MYNDRLNEDDVIRFTCTCCGVCCKSGLEIFLNPMDVWNLRNNLGITTDKINSKYIVFERRFEYGAYPVCLLKLKGKKCVFLDGNLCSIHHFRPAACRFFPVMQYYDSDRSPAYAMTPDRDMCPGLEEEKQYTVMGWLVINMFGAYYPVMKLVPEIAQACMMKTDDATCEELFRVMYNFDTVEDFPFRKQIQPPDNRKAARQFIKWLQTKTAEILGGV